jgi:inner membrane protein
LVLIAHLPAGYLLGKAMKARSVPAMGAALVGSVFPDFDMFWFHLVDHGAIHHHKYWVHAPGFWLMVSFVVLPVLSLARPALLSIAGLFFVAVGLHLCLDTLGGGIMWEWPFSTDLVTIVEVPATRSNWVLSFMFHWTFMAELLICLFATILFFRKDALT